MKPADSLASAKAPQLSATGLSPQDCSKSGARIARLAEFVDHIVTARKLRALAGADRVRC